MDLGVRRVKLSCSISDVLALKPYFGKACQG